MPEKIQRRDGHLGVVVEGRLQEPGAPLVLRGFGGIRDHRLGTDSGDRVREGSFESLQTTGEGRAPPRSQKGYQFPQPWNQTSRNISRSEIEATPSAL